MKPEPSLDHTRLDYPSDNMKLGAISHHIKQLHNGNQHVDLSDVASIMEKAYGVMEGERRIAEQAFARELGKPDPYRDENFSSREELIDELAGEYRKYGISSGQSHTKELVRSLEQQAAAQAREHLGLGR